MSITAYLGVPGSGKSLHVMEDIYWYGLRKDALIMTNFDVNVPKQSRATFKRLPEGELSVDDVLANFKEWLDDGHVITREGQVLVVIDEAQIPFNNRDWNKSGRAEWIRLFLQHRKIGMRFILVVQSLDMLDKQIRAVVEKCGHHMRVNAYGWFGTLISVMTLGKPVCMCIYRLPFYGSTKAGVIGRQMIIGKRRLYRMYDTHALFSKDLELGDVWGERVPEIKPAPAHLGLPSDVENGVGMHREFVPSYSERA